MTFRVNMNSCKNAMGTAFLLAAAFFVCSTFISMRSVFADPVVSPSVLPQRSGRQSPRLTNNTNKSAIVSRTASSRAAASRTASARGTTNSRVTARGNATTTTNRSVSPRTGSAGRVTNVASRGVVSRNQNSASRTNSNRAVRARTASSQSRVSATGTMMSGSRAGSSINYSYLSSKLYTGSYSNIVDSSTGLISADAYSNCMESYYACMDEICTARSDTKGRCSCAGRVMNFLNAEEALETANEELIKLSGQLSLLIATKGKGDDLAAAFSLTEAEQVMNCVSFREAEDVSQWYEEHPTFDASGNRVTSGTPSYCTNNSYGFNIKDIDGASSDVLASLKAYADAEDLAKQFSNDDTVNLANIYTSVSSIVNKVSGSSSSNTQKADVDSLANRWGYQLFQYAHNNVCSRVLDSCFNGIYEACGTPPTVTEVYKNSKGGEVSKSTHVKCANGSATSCPFNYNSAISIEDGGDIKLNERVSGASTTSTSSASCFGYTTTKTDSRGNQTVSSTDPYATLRGPVADARRSILQKYLLDANAACDTYGAALKQTAQNINYQKIAAEQALQQKRLEFKQEEDATALADATTAATNFDECLSELLDCYETQSSNTTSNGATWTLARVKTYCAQISQVPHCYETMICNPSTAQFHAVIDLPDSDNCFNSQDYTKNTCRNVVTISEILKQMTSTYGNIKPETRGSSIAMREQCLQDAGVPDIRSWTQDHVRNVACTVAELSKFPYAAVGYKDSASDEECKYITKCVDGYTLQDNQCVENSYDCTDEIDGAALATRKLESGKFGKCELQSCKENYTMEGNKCTPMTKACSDSTLADISANATAGTQTWDGENESWGECILTACDRLYTLSEINNQCMKTVIPCELPNAVKATRTWNSEENDYDACVVGVDGCDTGYHESNGKCVADE